PSLPHLSLPSFPTRRSSDLAHFHELVGVAGVAVAASELASAVRVDGPGEGHLAIANAAVQQRLGRQREVFDLVAFAQGFSGGGKDRKSTRLNSSHQIISYAV